MIHALITGELVADPQLRTSRKCNPFARLLQLKVGASVAMARALKAGVFEGRGGPARPSLDLQVDEVASTTVRPRKAKESSGQRVPTVGQGDCFGDLSGAGDIDWLEV